MSHSKFTHQRSRIQRRNFLRGVAGLSGGLPFLEGLPYRSAWAQNENPVFSLFIVAANGVVPQNFDPCSSGALSDSTMSGKAVGQLSSYAENLLIFGGLDMPIIGRSCGHAEGLVQTLTGVEPG
jgi:hypothetical protein